tara:strand:- start:4569 stop:5735 length:1167 start_codon:yes stop_codon:yes gene_type:complete
MDLNNVDIITNTNDKCSNFDDLNINDNLKRGIYAYGWEKPSKIQEVGIKPVIDGKDCIIQAQSGTGKTGTFCISCLSKVNPEINSCEILTISPTREIAEQSLNVMKELNKYLNYSIAGVIGGKRLNMEEIKTSNIIVGTPGRIFDLLQKSIINTEYIKLFVIDEADIMLQKGFREQVSSIIQYLKQDCQFAIYSATMPNEIIQLTDQFMNNPIKILVKKEELTLEGIKQYYIGLSTEEDKYLVLKDLYGQINVAQSIIYCSYRRKVEWLKEHLLEEEFTVSYIHGEMSQEIRDEVMNEFRNGKSRILITTDLLARGIDVPQVSLVINYDLPNDKESYIHRIGRSGRYGKKGNAINFVLSKDSQYVKELEAFYNTHISELPANIKDIII